MPVICPQALTIFHALNLLSWLALKCAEDPSASTLLLLRHTSCRTVGLQAIRSGTYVGKDGFSGRPNQEVGRTGYLVSILRGSPHLMFL